MISRESPPAQTRVPAADAIVARSAPRVAAPVEDVRVDDGRTEHPPIAAAIGGRVRRWREGRGWTLESLASRSGVSRRTLIAIEQGRANPSIAVLLRVSDAFGVGLAAIVEDSDPVAFRVHRAGSTATLWTGPAGGVGVLVGTTEPPHVVEHWEWRMEPGEQHDSEAHSAGTREILLVHSGALRLHAGQAAEILTAGDSAVFDGDQPHRYACASDGSVRFTMTVLQPDTRLRP